MVARAERSLFRASGLSMIDRSTAGAATGGARGEGAGFFLFPFFGGAMAMERGNQAGIGQAFAPLHNKDNINQRHCCRRSRNGGPQACLPAACGVAQVGAQCGPASSAQAQDPREGPSLTGWTTGSFLRTASSGWLVRRRRDQGGSPPERPVTQAMTIGSQVGARRAPACAVSLFPFRC